MARRDSMIPLWMLGVGALWLLTQKKQGKATVTPRRKKPSVAKPQRLPAQKPGQAILTDLLSEVGAGLSSQSWSGSSKAVLQQVVPLLRDSSPENEKQAYALLQSLPEDERQAFTMERGTAYGYQTLSEAKGFAMAGWVYLHFGGKGPDLVKMGQEKMGLPQTGTLDAATVQALRQNTGRGVWAPVLAQFGVGEEGI